MRSPDESGDEPGHGTGFEPATADFRDRVRSSFERQVVMRTIGAELVTVEPGLVEIELPHRADLEQQHGFLHAGMSTTIGDSAGGYAAFTLMPADTAVLAVEFKVSLVAPARGVRYRAVGRVKRPGKTLTVSAFDVLAIAEDGSEKLCVTGLHTAICLPQTGGLVD